MLLTAKYVLRMLTAAGLMGCLGRAGVDGHGRTSRARAPDVAGRRSFDNVDYWFSERAAAQRSLPTL